ncbi:MAG: NAD(P)H-dependent flavin oxidoreductase [Acidimicrobiales bacterium]
MPLHTPLCDLLSIDVPLLQAGMGKANGTPTSPALVAAVSESGGLGCIGAAGLEPDQLSTCIEDVRSRTERPFAVDLLVPPDAPGIEPTRAEIRQAITDRYPGHAAFVGELLRRHGLEEVRLEREHSLGHELARRQLQVVLDHQVPVLVLGLGDPGPIVPDARAAGTKVMALAGSPAHARRHADRGVDAVIAQGYEAGGHTGTIATFPLVPAVIDAIAPTPVVAAGGIADGRGMVAALALGAQAVWCGTAFLYALEADVSDEQRAQLADADVRDLVVSRCYTGKPSRIVRTPLLEEWEASGLEILPMPLQHVLMDDLVESARVAGRWDLVNNPAGQVAGRLRHHKPAAQIVADFLREAEEALVALR